MKPILACLILGGSLLAQSTAVFPSTHASIANGATGISWFPFSNGISRQQIVYEAWDLQLAAGTQITQLGFRQDGSGTSPARAVQLEVRMGYTTQGADTIGSNFDNNFSSTPVTVFGPAIFNLPQLTSATTGAPINIPLSTPFTWTGAANLLVEFRVTANNNGNQSFSYPLDSADFVSTVRSGVQGCLHSGSQRPRLTSARTRVGGNWSLSLQSAPANSFFFLLVTPGPMLSSPQSLQPFLAGIDPSCQLQIALQFATTLGAMTNSGGGYSWNVAVPNQRLLYNDFILSSQVAALDLFAPGGVVVSNADEVQIGIEPAATIVTSQGSATAATGSVYRNYGVVTRFN